MREGGDPHGVPVLSHHGTPGSSLLYEPLVADASARGIRFIAYDRPGYGGADRDVMSGEIAEWVLDNIRAGIRPSSDGWFDDDVVFVKPWGFDVSTVRLPMLVWQGEQDRFVPFAHGVWLAANIPGAEARLTPDDGHLTIVERHIGKIHGWLLERF